MFTGIIEAIGKILSIQYVNGEARLAVKFNLPASEVKLKIGESIAINGVCLTVEKINENSFEVYASKETMSLTNLHYLKVNDEVNLEQALMIGARLGGHFVTGHVDTVATVRNIMAEGKSKIFKFEFAEKFSEFLVPKGSVTLDGISLTINDCGVGGVGSARKGFLEVNIIPATQKKTIVAKWENGYEANLETDLIGKYLKAKQKNQEISLDFFADKFGGV